MKILWLTWKDLQHPLAGGAEVVNGQLARRLVRGGHEVTFVVGGFKGGQHVEVHPDQYKIIRLGNRYSLYYKAWRYYRKNLRGWADLVIDECNTMPFFAKFYVREPNIMFVHQLGREVWHYQMPWPLSSIGYWLEPWYMRKLRDRKVVTVSESTKQDLLKLGYDRAHIHIISEGIEIEPVSTLPNLGSKTKAPTMLSLGAMRPMKRTLDQIQAFEFAKAAIPNLKLSIAGDSSGRYGEKVLQAVQDSPYHKDITYHGKVSLKEKIKLLSESHVLVVTSIKEGWGLVVTEANSQGTPAAVYDIDGLRDSVQHQKTGMIAMQNNPHSLAQSVVTLLANQKGYEEMRRTAWEWSKTITFDKSYQQFRGIIGL